MEQHTVEKCAVEGCEEQAEYFYEIDLPVGDGEYVKVDENDFGDEDEDGLDVVKWTGEEKEQEIPFCEEHV